MGFFDLQQLDNLDPYLEQELAEAEALANKKDLAGELQRRFGNASGKQPWLVRNARSRRGAYFFSFCCNVISAAAGWYGALIVMEIIPIPYLNYLGAILGLFLMEKYKRKFSDSFWDTYWATKRFRWDLIAKNFSLLLVSLFLSVYGMYFAVHDFSPEAKQLGLGDNPEVAALQDRVRVIDSSLVAIRADQSNYNSQGQFYHIHAKKENTLSEERNEIASILKTEHGVVVVKNKDLLKDWKLRTGFRSYFGIIITLLSEFIFEICMAFCSYFDYRMHRAFEATRRRSKGTNGTPKKLYTSPA